MRKTLKHIWEFIGLNRLFCKHDWRLEQVLSGDIRNIVGGRYEWRCRKCNKAKFTDTL